MHAGARLALALSCLTLIGTIWAWTLERVAFERAEAVASAPAATQTPPVVATSKFPSQNDTREMHIGKPLPGRMTGGWAVTVSRRINRADGSFS